MFSRPASRAGTSTHNHHLFSTPLAIRTSAPVSFTTRKSVQRRLSSSKASCPPGGAGRPGSEGATGNTQGNSPAERQEQAAVPDRKPAGKRRSSKYAEAQLASMKAQHEAFSNVPAVPPTSHLHEHDVKLSSFFALHRPMSIHSSIPPSTSTSSFASLFDPPRTPKWKPADVIYTLNTAVSALDGSNSHTPQQSLHDSVLSQSPSNSGEAQSTLNLDDLVKKYRPFHKPPAPIPLDPELQTSQDKKSRKRQSKELAATSLAQNAEGTETKKFTTTLTATVQISKDPRAEASSFQISSISASPVVEAPSSPPKMRLPPPRATRQPFLTRMHARGATQLQRLEDRVASAQQAAEVKQAEDAEATQNPGNATLPADLDVKELREEEIGEGELGREMLLISVLRRRKLKMKKHKYKKLMKKTRNLRRREGKQ